MKNITIDINKISPTNNGVFEGWGTSLCWWANRVGFSKKLTEDFIHGIYHFYDLYDQCLNMWRF